MAELGHVKAIRIDLNGYERRERLGALAECPGCEAEVECWQHTEAWVCGDGGSWLHEEYGPAQGVCEPCGLLIVDSFDGCRVYRLRKEG